MNCEHLNTTLTISPYMVICDDCLEQWTEYQWTEYKEAKAIQDDMLEAKGTGN